MAAPREASRSSLGDSLSASTRAQDRNTVIQMLAARVEALEEACDVLSESFAVEAERSRALAAELERSQRQIVILTRALSRIARGDRAGALLESGMLDGRLSLAKGLVEDAEHADTQVVGAASCTSQESADVCEPPEARKALTLSGEHGHEAVSLSQVGSTTPSKTDTNMSPPRPPLSFRANGPCSPV